MALVLTTCCYHVDEEFFELLENNVDRLIDRGEIETLLCCAAIWIKDLTTLVKARTKRC